MQLVSNDSEDGSETEPILCQTEIVVRSQESSSSHEINIVGGDCSVADPEDLEADEIQSLVSADQPQSRICFDVEGLPLFRAFLEADENQSLVSADQPQCRICFDVEGEDLIAPCHCKGTQKYVHRSCLDNWRSTKEGFAFAHCTECTAVFILRANVPPDRWWLRLKFQFLVARDHAFIFIIVQLIVAFLGVLVYKFYGEELREMFGYEEHPYGFYALAVLAIVLVGLLYGFFIAIICGQRINERHYHVLAKQELTKEYIVEDRENSKDVPELESSHVSELRMMGLY